MARGVCFFGVLGGLSCLGLFLADGGFWVYVSSGLRFVLGGLWGICTCWRRVWLWFLVLCGVGII